MPSPRRSSYLETSSLLKTPFLASQLSTSPRYTYHWAFGTFGQTMMMIPQHLLTLLTLLTLHSIHSHHQHVPGIYPTSLSWIKATVTVTAKATVIATGMVQYNAHHSDHPMLKPKNRRRRSNPSGHLHQQPLRQRLK